MKTTLEKYQEQRLQKITMQNKKLELETERLRRDIGDVKKLRREVLAANAVVKRMMLAIAPRLAPVLAPLDNPREIHRLLEQAIIERLNAIAEASQANP